MQDWSFPESSWEERVPGYKEMSWVVWGIEMWTKGIHDDFPNLGGDATLKKEM